MTKRVVIVGGGIAGPVAAMALQRAGIEASVHEARGSGSDGVGAFLTIAENGLAALEVLDLRRLVEDLGMDTPAMVLVNGHGRELARLGMRSRTLTRSELYRALRDEAVRRGVEVRYSHRLTGVERVGTAPAGEGVLARFADGSTAEADVVVGADGLWSRTRTLIDQRAPRPRYLGLLNTGGFASGVQVPGAPGEARFVFGRRCFFGYLVHPDGDVWWFANPPVRREPPREQLQAITPEQWRARLVALFAADEGPMLDIIAATEQIVPPWSTHDLPRVPRWHDRRMVLVGDAAHAASPSSGQGASQAIEDAVVLAQSLRDVADAPAALATFEGLRRARVERVVRHGQRSGDGKSYGPVRARVRDLMLPTIMRHMDLDWLLEYRVPTSTPRVASRR